MGVLFLMDYIDGFACYLVIAKNMLHEKKKKRKIQFYG